MRVVAVAGANLETEIPYDFVGEPERIEYVD